MKTHAEKRRALLPAAGSHQQSRCLPDRVANSLVSTRVAAYQLPEWSASSGIEGLTQSRPGDSTHPGLRDGEVVGVCLPQKEVDILQIGVHTVPTNLAGPGPATTPVRQLLEH